MKGVIWKASKKFAKFTPFYTFSSNLKSLYSYGGVLIEINSYDYRERVNVSTLQTQTSQS